MRHVEHVLAKLGFRPRTQIAVWHLQRERPAPERGAACQTGPLT